jgi:hypothetical protein
LNAPCYVIGRASEITVLPWWQSSEHLTRQLAAMFACARRDGGHAKNVGQLDLEFFDPLWVGFEVNLP